MSAKNRPAEKKIRALERALRKGRLRRWLDLVQWAKDHGHANSTTEAIQLIIDDRIKSESHPLGKRVITREQLNEQSGKNEPVKEQIIDRYVPARLRDSLYVTDPEGA